jgi:hypothetical protein
MYRRACDLVAIRKIRKCLHIYPEGSPQKVDVSEAKATATSCRAAANTAEISDAEIGEQSDDLTTFVAS